MNVASKELCQELYELSGWSVTPAHFDIAYSLGYLLRKLEEVGDTITVQYHSPSQPLATDLKEWADMYTASTAHMRQRNYPYAGVPENAACKLAIELFKQGILTKEKV